MGVTPGCEGLTRKGDSGQLKWDFIKVTIQINGTVYMKTVYVMSARLVKLR